MLFASDLMMPVPLIATPFADIAAYKQSLANLHDFNLECIVQGHGDILLRGEVTSSIDDSALFRRDPGAGAASHGRGRHQARPGRV